MPVTSKAIMEDGKLLKDTRTPEYAKHCQQGHPYDPDCLICNQGYMRAKPAVRASGHNKKGQNYMKLLEGYNTDILFYNDQDVDDNIGLSGGILPKTAFPEGENITNKRAKTKEQAIVRHGPGCPQGYSH